MARRFPLYTDENVQGPLLKALKRQGWIIVRAVEIYPEGTPDDTHFEYAVQQGLVLVTNDEPLHSIAHRWLREGRPCPGMIAWSQDHYQRMSVGEIVADIEAIAAEDDPFGNYPIRYIKPSNLG